jgi:hypothetical protein
MKYVLSILSLLIAGVLVFKGNEIWVAFVILALFFKPGD